MNFHQLRSVPLSQLPVLFGRALARQQPVGGVSGQTGINQRLVKQFRMPGYPLVLITTDILQEGEDLHTFCARVVHFGISWTPSSMEQRTGRVDRIYSQTHRRLDNQPFATAEQLLQVYYPHLRDTVERLQVERVFERMNRFIQMLHHSLTDDIRHDSQINTAHDMVTARRSVEVINTPLKTAFPVQDQWLRTDLEVRTNESTAEAAATLVHFQMIVGEIRRALRIDPEPQHDEWVFWSTVFVWKHARLLSANETPSEDEQRHQPFTLYLHTVTGNGRVLLRCVSPIGAVKYEDVMDIEAINHAQRLSDTGKICAVPDTKLGTYNLTAEGDILFHPESTQLSEAIDLLSRTTILADRMEHVLLEQDMRMESFRDDLGDEPVRDLQLLIGPALSRLPDSWRTRVIRPDKIDVEISGGRKQMIYLKRTRDHYALHSIVLGTARVKYWYREYLIPLIWERNRNTDVVSFKLDRRERLIGQVDQLAASVDIDELAFYIEVLSLECDRFEFVLSGEDY